MSGNESPGDDSLSLSSISTSATTKSIASSSRDLSSIHQLDPKYKNYVSAVDKALKVIFILELPLTISERHKVTMICIFYPEFRILIRVARPHICTKQT